MPDDFADCIKGIARKGRAAGVHLIINAQTARSDVISGELKNNIPYRVAFSVTDWRESMAILEKSGAQRLLGNGDMLLSLGSNQAPMHVQAPTVELDEIQAVVSDIINQNGSAKYLNSFDNTRDPVESKAEYVLEILNYISGVKNIDLATIQRVFDANYTEAMDIIGFLEEYRAVSEYSGSMGRIVNRKNVDRLISEYAGKIS